MNDENQTVACPNCGSLRPASIPTCSNCGYGRLGPRLICPHCYAQNPPGAKVCINCYRPLKRSASLAVWILLFVIVGLPGGCLGGCFLLLGGGTDDTTIGLGLLGLLIFFGLLVMLVRSAKR